MTRSFLELALSDLAADTERISGDYLHTLGEAAVYRQMLSVAMQGWEGERRRAEAATQRLRQVMGREQWHAEETIT